MYIGGGEGGIVFLQCVCSSMNGGAVALLIRNGDVMENRWGCMCVNDETISMMTVKGRRRRLMA